MTAVACVAFATVASCAVAPWVTTLMSTRARSGVTDTVALPTAVMDAGRAGIWAQDAAGSTNVKARLAILRLLDVDRAIVRCRPVY